MNLNILIKVNNQEREKSTKKTLEAPETTSETVGDLRDQFDEEKPSKIQSHRLDFLYLIIIIFYFSVAGKKPPRQTKTNSVTKLGEEMLTEAKVL